MRTYLIAIAAGVLVAILYDLLNVRSPALPVVALIGLLSMLIGEQVVPVAKRVLCGEPLTAALDEERMWAGSLPGRRHLHNHQREEKET